MDVGGWLRGLGLGKYAAGGAHASRRRRRMHPVQRNFGRRGRVVFAKACELGLEGIVPKWAGSHYRSGPSRGLRKTKNPEFERTSPPCPATPRSSYPTFVSRRSALHVFYCRAAGIPQVIEATARFVRPAGQAPAG
jgi:hypothetical protein